MEASPEDAQKMMAQRIAWFHDPEWLIRQMIEMSDNEIVQERATQTTSVTERDKYAVSKFLEYVTNQPIVSFWGAYHLPGMIRLLEEGGFALNEDIGWDKALPILL
jgi:hypothetical protein